MIKITLNSYKDISIEQDERFMLVRIIYLK